MKIKATFKGKELQFLTSTHGQWLPAIGSDLKLYFFSHIKDMGLFTAQSALNDEKGYVDENKDYCFTPMNNCDVRRGLDIRFWERADTVEEFLELNGIS